MSSSSVSDSSTSAPSPLLRILPTRVRRNYRGGLQLDRLCGLPKPQDGDRPESWIASTLTATNPDLPPESGEGLTQVQTAAGETYLKTALEASPEFYLGAQHQAQLGRQLGFLAKLLDSSMRLHVQVHPTTTFAQTRMNAPYGKLEVYYVLDVREGCEGYIRLGFQHSPGRERWREIVANQDIAAMDACFEKIPVKKGDVWRVPGGLPHAIGEGVLMIEVMEPSDLVVRCEFEREGVVLPPNSRYMGRDLDFCLDVFDYNSYSIDAIRSQSQLKPQLLVDRAGWEFSQLITAEHSSCFEIYRLRTCRSGELPLERGELPLDGRCSLLIQTQGQAQLTHASGEPFLMTTGDSCFAAANLPQLHYQPLSDDSEMIICRPLLKTANPPNTAKQLP